MTSPTKPMGIVAGEWDWMRKMPAGTGQSIPFAAIMAMLNGQLGQSRGNVNLPSPGPNAPGGTITNAPAPVNPFGSLMAGLAPSGWSNPNAQAWTQQALGSPYMQGWGGPGTSAGGAAGVAPGAPAGPRLASDIVVSDQAKKMVKQFRKAKKAGDFGLTDAAMLAANVAMGVATGGASLAGQIAGGALGGASSLYGSDQKRKSIASQTGKIKKIRKAGMEALGYERGKGGDYVDAQGNKLGAKRVFQALLDAGYLG